MLWGLVTALHNLVAAIHAHRDATVRAYQSNAQTSAQLGNEIRKLADSNRELASAVLKLATDTPVDRRALTVNTIGPPTKES